MTAYGIHQALSTQAPDSTGIDRLGPGVRNEGSQSKLSHACPVEAVHRVQGAQHDLVICDLAMPRMDGIAVLKHLQISSPATVCILMNGYWDKEIELKAQRAGAFACVPKPLERKTFLVSYDTR